MENLAYINEFVSAKERRTFKNSYGSEISTRFWTIDRQRDYILFNYFEDREPPHDNSFIFYYKGFTLVLRVSQRIFTEPNIITWRLLLVSIPEQLDKKELFKELESAFAAFGYNGMPSVKAFDNSKYTIRFENACCAF